MKPERQLESTGEQHTAASSVAGQVAAKVGEPGWDEARLELAERALRKALQELLRAEAVEAAGRAAPGALIRSLLNDRLLASTRFADLKAQFGTNVTTGTRGAVARSLGRTPQTPVPPSRRDTYAANWARRAVSSRSTVSRKSSRTCLASSASRKPE